MITRFQYDNYNGLPGTRTRNQSDRVEIFLVKKQVKKSLSKPCLHFSLHMAFPMYTSKTQFPPQTKKPLKKLNTQLLNPYSYTDEHFIIEMNEFFVIPSYGKFRFTCFHNQLFMIGQIIDRNNIQIPNPSSIQPARNRRNSWEDERKNLFFLRKKFF